ncbi:MAG: hypothetical protein IV086_02910 [Hyphomonadaceae bacterium]|nr:hypothetical protein [Hyphomonadaceae bacterium]
MGIHSNARTTPHAKFSDVANAGHTVTYDRNDAFIETVFAFWEVEQSAN